MAPIIALPKDFASFASLLYHPGMIGPSNKLAVSGTRRDFVKAVSAGSLLLAVDSRLGWCASVDRAPQTVSVWVTGPDGHHVQRDLAGWKPLEIARANAIFVDESSVKQDILGFGGAMTDATCYLLSRMPGEQRSALMHELFAADAMALNVCRTTIGASDYSVSAYSYDESPEPDPELKKFSIDHDRTYILPMLRASRALCPASPWCNRRSTALQPLL